MNLRFIVFSFLLIFLNGLSFSSQAAKEKVNEKSSYDLMRMIWEYEESQNPEEKERAEFLINQVIETLKYGDAFALSKNPKKGAHESVILSFKFLLNKDEITIKAIFKPEAPLKPGTKINSEIAAYEFDQLFSFHLVPITTMRIYNEMKGSIQLMVNARVGKDYLAKGNELPKLPAKLKIFDYLTKSWDRKINPGNYLFYQDERVVAIDHGWSFKRFGILNVMAYQPILHLRNTKEFMKDYDDEETYKKILSISDENTSKVLAPYLSKAQIKKLLKRIHKYKKIHEKAYALRVDLAK